MTTSGGGGGGGYVCGQDWWGLKYLNDVMNRLLIAKYLWVFFFKKVNYIKT